MKKKCWIVLCVVFMLSVAAGCGSKSMETMSDFASGESSMNAAIENEDYKNEGEIAAEEGITSENGLDGQVAAGRKLIRTVYLSLQTTEFDSVLSNLSEKTAELGGYIENSSVSGHSYYYNNTRYASYTIRIPTAELNQFVDVVSEIGNVTQKNESVEDVTLQYVDVESRKKVLETEQERLMELLSSAENMEDLLAIESKLSEVRYELENYGSQLRMLDNQIDYSTVNVDVDEVERITETGEKSFFAERQLISGRPWYPQFRHRIFRIPADHFCVGSDRSSCGHCGEIDQEEAEEEKRIKSFLIFGLRYDKVVNSSKFYLYHDRLDHRYSQ